MTFPPEPQPRAGPTGVRAGPRARLAGLVTVLVLLWGGVIFWYLRSRASVPLPDAALGSWTTTDQRYADRTFVLTDSSVTLSVGAGVARTYPFTRVRHESAGGAPGYRITYSDSSGALEMVVYLDTGTGTLRLENPPDVVWYRSP